MNSGFKADGNGKVEKGNVKDIERGGGGEPQSPQQSNGSSGSAGGPRSLTGGTRV